MKSAIVNWARIAAKVYICGAWSSFDQSLLTYSTKRNVRVASVSSIYRTPKIVILGYNLPYNPGRDIDKDKTKAMSSIIWKIIRKLANALISYGTIISNLQWPCFTANLLNPEASCNKYIKQYRIFVQSLELTIKSCCRITWIWVLSPDSCLVPLY